MKKIISVLIIGLFISGCCMFDPPIVVTNKYVPIQIDKSGCFVDNNQYIEMLKGQSIDYSNDQVGMFYLSPMIIDIKDGKVSLKQPGTEGKK